MIPEKIGDWLLDGILFDIFSKIFDYFESYDPTTNQNDTISKSVSNALKFSHDI